MGLILIAPEDREWVKCSDEKDLYRYVYNGWKVDKVLKDYKGEYPQIFLSKDDRIKEFMDRGVSFENIPRGLVEEYGRIDVEITRKLFDSQMNDLRLDKNKGLINTIKMMNEFLIVLTDMERNGIHISLDTLSDVERIYRAEFEHLKQKIDKIVYEKMGDTRINLASPEQLSWLIYSKKPKDKTTWARLFNIGIDKQTGKNKKRPQFSRIKFRELVRNNTELLHKTTANQCIDCKGKGVIKKMKIAYQNWYHDVGKNNDYSWPRFFIGSELENPMYLYQYAGVWPNAEVIKSGKYDITAFIPDRIPQTDMIGHVIFGNTHTTLSVKAGSKSYKFENIYLEKGGGVLKIHLNQGGKLDLWPQGVKIEYLIDN